MRADPDGPSPRLPLRETTIRIVLDRLVWVEFHPTVRIGDTQPDGFEFDDTEELLPVAAR